MGQTEQASGGTLKGAAIQATVTRRLTSLISLSGGCHPSSFSPTILDFHQFITQPQDPLRIPCGPSSSSFPDTELFLLAVRCGIF